MIDPEAFGGRDFELESGDADALVRYRRDSHDTPLKEKLDRKGFTGGEVELPKSWLEEQHPRKAVESRMRDEVYGLLTKGLENGDMGEEEIGIEVSDLDAQLIGACEMSEDSDVESRMVAQVLFPANGYDIMSEEDRNFGIVAYDAWFKPLSENSWQSNTERGEFHYTENESIYGQGIDELLFEGLHEERNTLPEHRKESGADGYTGRFWVRYNV